MRICRWLCSRGAPTSASFADASDLALTLPAPPGAAASTGDDLSAFVNRTVTSAYATAAEIEAASARGRDPRLATPRRAWRNGSSWWPARSRRGRRRGSTT